MSDERRFDEDEIAEILERAASPEATASPAAAGERRGLTLAQLQEIGAEVGIEPALIARAAGVVAGRGSVPAPETLLGLPRSVARTVPIERALDDDEWTRLVVDLRETFGAQGKLREHGTLRSWSNGNLQVHVEPDADRYRVRMRTSKGDAGMRLTVASVAILAAIGLLVSTLGDAPTGNLIGGSLLGLAGLLENGRARAALKRWAGERAEQMEGLAERIPRLLKRGEPDT
jgi:hypothetical protein